MVEPCHSHKDVDRGKNLGCKITTRFDVPNGDDAVLVITDSFDDVKQKIVTAVGKS
jgi:hypothetical protein